RSGWLALWRVTFGLGTAGGHANHRARRRQSPKRRLARLIFELLTIGLVTLQEFAALELLRRSLCGDIVEADRHDDAERRIGKIEMGRRGKRLRLLEQEDRPPSAIRTPPPHPRSPLH